MEELAPASLGLFNDRNRILYDVVCLILLVHTTGWVNVDDELTSVIKLEGIKADRKLDTVTGPKRDL